MLTYCDVTDLVSNAERLETLATIDALTGVHNRRHFLSAAEAEWNRFQRYHRPLAMVMLDIDHFKSINDRYGHATGDEVIRLVARRCSDEKRGSDVIGRVGGEEFAILLPETEPEQAHLVAERLREKLAAQIFSYEKVHFRITVSIGIAAASISMSGVSALMRDADLALYQAKALGRNKVALYRRPEPGALRNAAE